MRHAVIFGICTAFIAGLSYAGAEEAAPEFSYYSKGTRDPFLPLITGDVRTSMGLRTVETIEDVKFEGIIFDPAGGSLVMLNGEVLRENQRVYNVRIIEIQPEAVTLSVYDQEHTIYIEEDGR